uniref:Uncharacterized protein n=1 Tax=Rhizophora mucronata TaxID=61149 RepID=A0A2P2Q6G6_RHIMU
MYSKIDSVLLTVTGMVKYYPPCISICISCDTFQCNACAQCFSTWDGLAPLISSMICFWVRYKFRES